MRLDAADQLTCGGEGTEPITVYNWRTGAVLSTYADDEPPLGVCSCLQREGVVLAAGNTFSHSQVRVWDVSRGSLTDRFSLAPQCRGVRCLQIVSGAREMIAGCANGWIVFCDLRTGRFERHSYSHSDCINSLFLHGDYLLSASDDGLVKLTDRRTFGAEGPIAIHKFKRIVSSACCDDEHIFAGMDDGTVRVFDYSFRGAATLRRRQQGGGFTVQQREAFSAAIEAARRRELRMTESGIADD